VFPRNRLLGLAVSVVTGISSIGLSGYFISLGLTRADMVASVVSAVAGVVGLFLSAYGLMLGRRVGQPDERSAQADPISLGERAVGSVVGGGPVVTGDGNVVSWGDVKR